MRLVACLLLSCIAAWSDPPASPTSETPAQAAVHERADKFYALIVAGKFRQAEDFVVPSDRDTYYNMEKPKIKSYRITAVSISKDNQKADISIASSTVISRPMVGAMEIPLSFISHWKLENGTWFWFVPTDEVRQTPFGPMHFTKDTSEPKPLDLKKMIAQGPTPEQLQSAVKADKSSFSIAGKEGSSAVVHLQNTLSGSVQFTVTKPENSAFKIDLRPDKLPAYQTGLLVLTRIHPPGAAAEQILVKVEPTHQTIALQVR